MKQPLLGQHFLMHPRSEMLLLEFKEGRSDPLGVNVSALTFATIRPRSGEISPFGLKRHKRVRQTLSSLKLRASFEMRHWLPWLHLWLGWRNLKSCNHHKGCSKGKFRRRRSSGWVRKLSNFDQNRQNQTDGMAWKVYHSLINSMI